MHKGNKEETPKKDLAMCGKRHQGAAPEQPSVDGYRTLRAGARRLPTKSTRTTGGRGSRCKAHDGYLGGRATRSTSDTSDDAGVV